MLGLSTALEAVRGQSDRDQAWIAAFTADRDRFHEAEQVGGLQHVRDAIAALGSRLSLKRYTAWAKQKCQLHGSPFLRSPSLRYRRR